MKKKKLNLNHVIKILYNRIVLLTGKHSVGELDMEESKLSLFYLNYIYIWKMRRLRMYTCRMRCWSAKCLLFCGWSKCNTRFIENKMARQDNAVSRWVKATISLCVVTLKKHKVFFLLKFFNGFRFYKRKTKTTKNFRKQ